MEGSQSYEEYLINVLKAGSFSKTRSIIKEEENLVVPVSVRHYGSIYYLPIYDSNNKITNETLVVNSFNYLIENRGTNKSVNYIDNFDNAIGCKEYKNGSYYLLDKNLNKIKSSVPRASSAILVRGKVYNNYEIDLPSSYVDGIYDPSLYDPNNPRTWPMVDELTEEPKVATKTLPISYIDGIYNPDLYDPNNPATFPLIDEPIENTEIIEKPIENKYKKIKFTGNFTGINNLGNRLKYINKHYPDIIMVDKDAQFSADTIDNIIVYPVINPITGELNEAKKISNINPPIYIRMACKIRTTIRPHADTQLAKELFIYPPEFDVKNKTEEECKNSKYFQFYDLYDYTYYWIGNYNAIKKGSNNFSFCSEFELKLYRDTILSIKKNQPYSKIIDGVVVRAGDLGYNINNRNGPQILMHLWAAYDLGYYFTNFDCSDLPSKLDKYLYPILDISREGHNEFKAGWGKFIDNKYYPFNYDVNRTLGLVQDTSNIYSKSNEWNTYQVEGNTPDFFVFGDQVALDPITKKPDDNLFKASSAPLEELQERTKSKITNTLITLEELAVIAAALFTGAISFYVTGNLTISLSGAGIILIVGSLGVIAFNYDELFGNVIKSTIPTSVSIAYKLTN